MSFKDLAREIQLGLDGKNSGIPMGFNRLDKYVGLRKRIFTTVFGGTGCHALGTKILMYDGSFKTVENIKVGDVLMGPDSNPRNVLELKQGVEQMYKIVQNKGISYTVNQSHILRLRKNTKGVFSYINITVKDYLLKDNKFKHLWKGYKVGLTFKEQKINIDPYFLGMWLGDGTSSKPQITNIDSEIIKVIYDFAKSINNRISVDKISYNIVSSFRKEVIMLNDDKQEIKSFLSLTEASVYIKRAATNISESIKKNIKCGKYFWKYGKIAPKSFKTILIENKLLNNKHIPSEYLYNSTEIRLQLLAGLIDSDGTKTKNGNYEITFKNKQLANDLVFLSRSLGFYTSIVKKEATLKRKDLPIYKCDMYRISIYGNDLSLIPCKIKRKIFESKSTRLTDCLSTGFKIEKLNIDDYYGFTLDGDNLYLLEDFTVTHNTGKTAFVHNAYILRPFDYIQNNRNSKMKMKVILFSMERSKIYTIAKWLSRKIFVSQGILIPIPKLLGWWDTKLSKDEHDLVLTFEDYINELCEFVDIIEGSQNPTGIYKYVKNYAEKNGKFEQVDEFTKIYIPNEHNELVIPIIDHYGLTKPEKSMNKKEAIDKVSEYCQYFRDQLGYSPVGVSQINREISSYMTKNIQSFEPSLDHIKESGRPAEDSDIVISLFQPSRYKTEDPSYKVDKFINPVNGGDYFRGLKILKNSYGESDLRCGMAFMGSTGMFTELPKAKDMTDFDYESLFNNTYFLE